MHDRDIRLTDEEQRIIAEIERHERARRSPWRCWRTVFGRRPATRTQQPAVGAMVDSGTRGDGGAWEWARHRESHCRVGRLPHRAPRDVADVPPDDSRLVDPLVPALDRATCRRAHIGSVI